ncbi:MAG TPA: hypothetical protein VFI04_02685 [Gaiellaceae bacterium]|nr:hypothetical protein [Gaiellaceae bacterium]
MTAAEDYLLLGLRLGRHVEGLVDSYCGPPELKEQADAEEPVAPAQLAADAASLRDRLDDGWLRDQVVGCWTYARVLAGEQLSYSDEVEGCYGVRPERTPEAVYEQAHAELDELLPGEGSLLERKLAWRERQLCPGDRAIAVLADLLPLLRSRTLEVVDLPENERVTLDPVSGEPWWAFNYYQGGLHSHVVVNTDVPTTGLDVLHLGSHEVYPGHHTEHALKEHLLGVEETIQLVPTPQAVVSEGIAEAGGDVVLDDAAREQAYAVIRGHGLELPDPGLAERIKRAGDALGTIGVNVALMIHEDGASVDDGVEYAARWGLRPLDEARRSVSFVTDPTWRAYTITYSAGEDLCRAYIGDDRSRLRRLLTEHVRVGELSSR